MSDNFSSKYQMLQHLIVFFAITVIPDLVLDPQAYNKISYLELEQIQADENYHFDFSLEVIERIDKLPSLISLALPFLRTLDEVEIHRLLNKYNRGLHDSFYRRRDSETTNLGEINTIFHCI